ncbi:MAG: methylated-DNA--[protein]-cysteine S-methyltransferase [Oscillospiraceae bacterium]|jgi:methylated-DNA-[protein]-cysteine S-methyltransferase
MKSLTFDSPLGPLTITEENGQITSLSFGASRDSEPTPLLLEAKIQLEEYFAGKRREFRLPLAPKGTEFQQRVWKALLAIPYGETRSYGEIARDIGNPRASRAVGMANNRNPIAIIIPCHRVIGSTGRLVGYGGGLDKKEFLLNIERQYSSQE